MEKTDLATTNVSENPLARAARATNCMGGIASVRCKVCHSPFREQAEKMYDEQVPVLAIFKFLKDSGEDFTQWQVRAHFEHHYKQMMIQAAILDYKDHLDTMMSRRKDMVEDTLRQIDIAWTELAQALAVPVAGDLDKMEKKHRVISGYQRTIKELYEFLQKMHDSEAKARAIEERFVRIWEMKLLSAKTEDEKKLLIATLQDFKDKIQQTEKL